MNVTTPNFGERNPAKNNHAGAQSSAKKSFDYETVNLFGTRPIVASDLQVSDTINSAGIRPIATSDLQVSDTINILGNRPIAASELSISKTLTTSGLRPIAANISEKLEVLMGYLD